MSIDSIESQRRLLEEQRAREISRIERERKDEIARIENEKTRELKKIAEDQQSEVTRKANNADWVVSRAEEAANNRIKDYESQVSRMTDDAKRQFQAKATLLQKNAEEIEHQRGHLLKQHEESLKALHQQHDSKMIEDKLKLERQANQSYMNQLRNVRDVEERGKVDLALARQENNIQKQAEKIEGQREVASLEHQRDMQKGLIEGELTRDRTSAREQLEMQRIKQEANQAQLQEKFEDQVSDLKRKKMADVNRQHIQGRRQIEQVSDFYNTQSDQLSKDAKKKMRDVQNHSLVTLQGMEQDAKQQEFVAKNVYDYQKAQRMDERQKTLELYKDENEKIRNKLDTNYKTQTLNLKKEKEDLLLAQKEQYKNELSVQKQLGETQLNQSKKNSIEKLSSHDSKQSDPFYRIQSINPMIDDLDKMLIVRIRIPEHEQDQVRLTEQDGKIALSGNRRFESKVTDESGRKISTNSFQSYSETFPINGKLQFKQMVRTYSDGILTFKIPKF